MVIKISVKAAWITGESSNYGILLMQDNNLYFAFEINQSGESLVSKYQYSKYSTIYRNSDLDPSILGNKEITLSVLVKNDNLDFFCE